MHLCVCHVARGHQTSGYACHQHLYLKEYLWRCCCSCAFVLISMQQCIENTSGTTNWVATSRPYIFLQWEDHYRIYILWEIFAAEIFAHEILLLLYCGKFGWQFSLIILCRRRRALILLILGSFTKRAYGYSFIIILCLILTHSGDHNECHYVPRQKRSLVETRICNLPLLLQCCRQDVSTVAVCGTELWVVYRHKEERWG